MGRRKLAVTPMDETVALSLNGLGQKQKALWASDCAEHVLKFFEEASPEDLRPRKAVEAVRAWASGILQMTDVRKAAFAAHAAAREAIRVSAASAARSAGQAAGTAHMAGHAVHAARYAVTAARDAEPEHGEENAFKEREWQLLRLQLYI